MIEAIHFSKILVTVRQTTQSKASRKKTPTAWGQSHFHIMAPSYVEKS